MSQRNKQLWLITFRDLSKLKPKKQTVTSPPCFYKWEAMLWLKNQKPMAELESIEPFRKLALPK